MNSVRGIYLNEIDKNQCFDFKLLTTFILDRYSVLSHSSLPKHLVLTSFKGNCGDYWDKIGLETIPLYQNKECIEMLKKGYTIRCYSNKSISELYCIVIDMDITYSELIIFYKNKRESIYIKIEDNSNKVGYISSFYYQKSNPPNPKLIGEIKGLISETSIYIDKTRILHWTTWLLASIINILIHCEDCIKIELEDVSYFRDKNCHPQTLLYLEAKGQKGLYQTLGFHDKYTKRDNNVTSMVLKTIFDEEIIPTIYSSNLLEWYLDKHVDESKTAYTKEEQKTLLNQIYEQEIDSTLSITCLDELVKDVIILGYRNQLKKTIYINHKKIENPITTLLIYPFFGKSFLDYIRQYILLLINTPELLTRTPSSKKLIKQMLNAEESISLGEEIEVDWVSTYISPPISFDYIIHYLYNIDNLSVDADSILDIKYKKCIEMLSYPLHLEKLLEKFIMLSKGHNIQLK